VLAVFFDIERTSPGRTANRKYFVDVLIKLRQRVKESKDEQTPYSPDPVPPLLRDFVSVLKTQNCSEGDSISDRTHRCVDRGGHYVEGDRS